MLTTQRVGVRALCEFTARRGDLDLRFTPSPSASEGVAGHVLVQSRRGADYEREVPLQGQYQELTVAGRADGWSAQALRLEEIKTYRGSLEVIRPNHQSLHWAQAKVYGHLLCASRGLDALDIVLVYFNIATQEESTLVEYCQAHDLEQFFHQLCARFLSWSRQEVAHRAQRDAALKTMAFPQPAFRPGQRTLAVTVYRAACAQAPGQTVLLEAPTGIGKTLGTVFPMLKACPSAELDKVFFLTAKGTGHEAALHALRSLKVPGLRVLDMQARDKSCEHPDKACHGDSCPLARGFFDRLPEARHDLVSHDGVWDAMTIRERALRHDLCPYYLAQEMVRWSDVVVADYHYYYDTSAGLYALTQHLDWQVGVLVDEAHNLVDRARNMYTATLSQHLLKEARTQATGPVRRALQTLHKQWRLINLAQAQPYQAYERMPASLLSAVQRAVHVIAQTLSDQPLMPSDPVLKLYWELLQFTALSETFDQRAIFDIQLEGRAQREAKKSVQRSSPAGTRKTAPYSTLCIRNVVPAPYLQSRHAAAQVTIFFSGTLAPFNFYHSMLGLPAQSVEREVPAPFQSAQLQVKLAAQLSTRYRDRQASLRQIVDIAAQQFWQRPGNYLCFVSSFEYLQQLSAALAQNHPQVPQWQQTPSMDEAQRQAFLSRFQAEGQGIGLAVLGGAFSEGIDLPGQRLIGAFIATLGLPQVNPVNDAMMQALHRYGLGRNGYDYTYLFPGLRKVVQAAGRVIRTESDEGVIVLLDERYGQARVQRLLPRWWPQAQHI